MRRNGKLILGMVASQALVAAVLFVLPAASQTPVLPGANFPCPGSTSQCFKPPIAGVPLGYQQLTSLSASTALTIPSTATEAFIVCESQDVRWRDDGTAPTASVGMLLPAKTPFTYTGKLSAFRVIETTPSATCNVSYYK